MINNVYGKRQTRHGITYTTICDHGQRNTFKPTNFPEIIGSIKILILDEVTKSRKRNCRNRHLSLEITRPRKELHLLGYYLDCSRGSLYIVHNNGSCFFAVSIRVWGRVQQIKQNFREVISSFWECCHLWFSPNFIYNNVVYKHRWILFYQTLTVLIQWKKKQQQQQQVLFPFRLLPNTTCHG